MKSDRSSDDWCDLASFRHGHPGTRHKGAYHAEEGATAGLHGGWCCPFGSCRALVEAVFKLHRDVVVAGWSKGKTDRRPEWDEGSVFGRLGEGWPEAGGKSPPFRGSDLLGTPKRGQCAGVASGRSGVADGPGPLADFGWSGLLAGVWGDVQRGSPDGRYQVARWEFRNSLCNRPFRAASGWGESAPKKLSRAHPQEERWGQQPPQASGASRREPGGTAASPQGSVMQA